MGAPDTQPAGPPPCAAPSAAAPPPAWQPPPPPQPYAAPPPGPYGPPGFPPPPPGAYGAPPPPGVDWVHPLTTEICRVHSYGAPLGDSDACTAMHRSAESAACRTLVAVTLTPAGGAGLLLTANFACPVPLACRLLPSSSPHCGHADSPPQGTSAAPHAAALCFAAAAVATRWASARSAPHSPMSAAPHAAVALLRCRSRCLWPSI